MNTSLITNALFAQISRWERLGDGIHRGRGRMDLMELLPLGLVLLVVAAGIFAFLAIRKRNDMSQQCDDPHKLFRELSLAHQLDRGSQKLLWRLVEAFQLARPADVFLQPALFNAEKLPQELRDKAANLQELRQRLF